MKKMKKGKLEREGKKICFFSLLSNSTNGAPRKSNRPYPQRDIYYEKISRFLKSVDKTCVLTHRP
jgi:hypothetical protein